MSDLLAPFRRPGSKPAATVEDAVPSKEGGYRAFTVADGGARPVRFDVMPCGDLAVARAYSQLTEIAYEHRGDCNQIMLFFPQTLLTIEGGNLRSVAEALIAGTCACLIQLGSDQQAEPGQPVITKITTARKKPAGS